MEVGNQIHTPATSTS